MGAEELLPGWLPRIPGDEVQRFRSSTEYARWVATRLEEIASDGGENSAAANEFLGCIQLQVFNDATGAARSLRLALAVEPSRYRSWEMLTLAAAHQGAGELVEAAEARVSALPLARSSVLLVKSYDRQGDTLRASWTALNAVTSFPNDFQVNLSLAAMLLKEERADELFWRVGEALTKAEKQMGRNPTRQSQIDFVLVKSIYLALTQQIEQARRLVESVRPIPPELQEVLRTLGE